MSILTANSFIQQVYELKLYRVSGTQIIHMEKVNVLTHQTLHIKSTFSIDIHNCLSFLCLFLLLMSWLSCFVTFHGLALCFTPFFNVLCLSVFITPSLLWCMRFVVPCLRYLTIILSLKVLLNFTVGSILTLSCYFAYLKCTSLYLWWDFLSPTLRMTYYRLGLGPVYWVVYILYHISDRFSFLPKLDSLHIVNFTVH